LERLHGQVRSSTLQRIKESKMVAQILNVAVWFFFGSGICSLLSMLFPSNHKYPVVQFLLDGMNLWGFNQGKAQNKDEVRP